MMTCGRARRLLWPGAGPRQATAELEAARDHAAGCDACRGFLEDMLRIGERIAAGAPRPAAPPELRERLFESLARARTDIRAPRAARLRQVAIVVAALLVVAVGVVGYLAVQTGWPGRPDPLGSIAEDRLRSQQGAGLASSDSLQVARWLAERLPYAVQIPMFPGSRLTGVRLLMDNRRAGAVVEYLIEGRSLTYYVLPGGGAGLQRDVRLVSRDGYRVASWHDSGLTHALAGTLPGPRLIELARYCIHQMMA
ncbi:MAG TPA: hypothetical protein VFU40_01900 [Gemmatimonadales bacterium]|nr:hypothetical protein [Gemmatimonadales bacterium]